MSEKRQQANNFPNKIIFVVIATVIILLVLMFSRLSIKNNNEEAINNKTLSVDKAELKNIIITSEIQDLYDGKQKVVVWIQNKSKKVFSGSVITYIYDSADKQVGNDVIYPEDLKPGDKKFTILWTKPGASYIKWEVKGEFKELTTSNGSTNSEAIKEEAIKELFNDPVAYGKVDSIIKIENWAKGERRKIICVDSKGEKSEYTAYFIDNQLVSQYLIYNGKETLLWNDPKLNPMD